MLSKNISIHTPDQQHIDNNHLSDALLFFFPLPILTIRLSMYIDEEILLL